MKKKIHALASAKSAVLACAPPASSSFFETKEEEEEEPRAGVCNERGARVRAPGVAEILQKKKNHAPASAKSAVLACAPPASPSFFV